MKTIVLGHKYELANFENPESPGQTLQFIQKRPIVGSAIGNHDLETAVDGTTNEEVLRMLITRMKFLQEMFPCRENAIAITKMEEALMWLEKRTADRQARNVEGKHVL